VQDPYQQVPNEVLAFEFGMLTVTEGEVVAAVTGRTAARIIAMRKRTLDDPL
jgi:hypothetical protein